MPPGMWNMMKVHFVGMSVPNEEYKFHISYFPVSIKQTHILSYTHDNTLRMISEIMCTEKDEGALMKDWIKGYTNEHK
jgi:hypothetical protein